MTQVKNIDDLKLFYSDTDSGFFNKPLIEELVSDTELGKFKLEAICKKVIFLAPKCYALVTIDDKIIIKVKGLSKEGIDELIINDLETLLIKDNSLEINQDKWYRSLTEGTITIKEQLYHLKVTDNKRVLIYNDNNKLISTKAILLNNENN